MSESEAQERFIAVPPEDDGQRLDRWLKKRMPFPLVQKLIRKGAIRVDGKKAKGDMRIAEGQEVRLPPLEDKPEKAPYKISDDDAAFIKSLALYDDGDVVAINKPAGLASQGGGDERRHIDGLLPALENKKGLAPRLVHRLDKETSGVLLLARSPEAVRALGKSFKTRDVQKIYWAVTAGVPEQPEGEIRAPIGKVKGPIKDKMMIDENDGKNAVTDYIILDRMTKQAAFVAFWPRTGRTHQIRVHAAAILECPVLGDGKYGGEDEAFDAMGVPHRLHLHARRLILPHPVSGAPLDIMAPLDDTLTKSWQMLGFDPYLKDNPFADETVQ